MAAVLLMATSCLKNSDNHYTIRCIDYNLVIDKDNPDAEAQASFCGYDITYYYDKGALTVNGSDIIISNQKYSFETDTMAYRTKYFKAQIDGEEISFGQMVFSKEGLVGAGAPVSDLKGAMLGMYAPATSDTLSNNFNLKFVQRLDLNYILSDRYQVQTFWHTSLYLGQTYTSSSLESFSSRNPRYLVNLDFSQNKATVFVYNPELSTSDDNLPKVIRIGDIPVRFNHDSYYLEAAAPKTTVLSKRNKVPALIDSVGFQVEDFSLRLMSEDLTDAEISFKLQGKSVNFIGSCVPKPSK